MKKVKVAVIGYGHLGKWHTQKADQLETSELVGVVEPNENTKKLILETYPQIKVVSHIEEIIDEIDAAVIVTPTSTHFDLCKMLLKANKHIFCEKPLCSTYEQALNLKDEIKDQVVQVGHSERCHEVWENYEEQFSKLPAKKTIKLTRHAAFKGRATDVDVVQDLMIHDIDLMLYLFKEKPRSVISRGYKIRTDKWDHVCSHFYYDSGMDVIITSGRNHVKEVRSLEVMSSKGCTYVDLFQGNIQFATHAQYDDGEYVKGFDYHKRDHLLIEQKAFYEAILNGSRPMVTYDDGLNAVYYVSNVLESLDSSKLIEL